MQAVAKLKNLPVAPRKVRLVADLIRGMGATKTLAILKHVPKKCAIHLEKLLVAAVANWEQKNEQIPLEKANLYVKAIWIDGAGMLKRLRPAPQGRAHKIRKRSSHITLVVGDTYQEPPSRGQLEEIGAQKQLQHAKKNTDGTKS